MMRSRTCTQVYKGACEGAGRRIIFNLIAGGLIESETKHWLDGSLVLVFQKLVFWTTKSPDIVFFPVLVKS